jgi:anti-anti-sigma factor
MAIPIHDLSTPDLIRIRIESSDLRDALTVEVKERLKALLEASPRDISLDLAEVRFIDSLAIGVILYFAHVQKRSGYGLLIEEASPELRSTLERLALGQLLKRG